MRAGALASRVAIVTGAGSDIGRAIVRRLLQGGGRVVAGVHSSVPDHSTFGESEFGQLAVVQGDLREECGAAQLVKRAADDFGRIDIVVAGAAITELATAAECGDAEWARVIDVNLGSVQRLIRAANPHLVPGGSIIAVGSLGTGIAWPNDAAYIASKSGLAGLIRSAAADFGPRGIRANCVSPGMIDGGLFRRWLDAQPDRNAVLRSELARISLGRLGAVDEVASAVAFLASDEARYITGQVLYVDGGYLAR